MKNCRYFKLFISGLAFVGLLSWFLISLFQPARPSLEKYGNQLSAQIEHRKSELLSILENVRKAVSQEPASLSDENLWDNEFLLSSFGKQYSLVIFKDKRKVFWNNSNIPFYEIDSVVNESILLNRPDGIYLFSSIVDGLYTFIITEPIYLRYTIKNQYLKEGFVNEFAQYANKILIANDINSDLTHKVRLFDGSLLQLTAKENEVQPLVKTSSAHFDGIIALLLISLFLFVHTFSRTFSHVYQKRVELYFPFVLIMFFVVSLIIFFWIAGVNPHPINSPVLFTMNSLDGFPLSASILFLLMCLSFSYLINRLANHEINRPLKALPIALAATVIGVVGEWLFSGFIQKVSSEDLFLSLNVRNLPLVNHTLSMLLVASATIYLIGNLLKLLIESIRTRKEAAQIIFIPLILQIIFLLAFDSFVYLLPALFLIFVIALLPIIINRIKFGLKLTAMLSWIVISTTLAVLFGVSNQKLADEEQLLTAKKLSADNDPLLEFLFTDLRKALLSDSVLSQLIFSQDIEDQYLNTYIRENYITGYISKYETEITTCFTNQELVLQPENRKVNCIDYFRSLVAMRGKELIPNDLFLINNNLLGVHYVGYLPFKDKKNTQSDSLNLFIEFYYKYIPEGTGYPDLLIDASKGIGPNLNKYSFASYRDGSLYYKFGSYFFPLRLEQMTNKTEGYFNRDGYRHAVLMFADKVLLISRKENNWAETMAPFSFFLLFNGFILLLLVLLQNGLPDFRKAFSTFRTRLQLIISVSLLSSFAMIGVITTIYMAEIYKKKNDDFLAEKTQSLLVELEHKLKDIPWGSLAKRDYLNQLLLKFSLVFFTDINLYDSDGRLMATSRPEIFKLRLTGEMMHPEAFRALHFQNRLYLRQYEEIGNARFISAYAPFKNSNGDAIAYINLPYFVKETEMQREVRSMVLSYLNLFLLLSAFSLLFALFVSRRLTKPLQMIQQKMSRVQLGDSNEKIQYQGYDEIGELVKQYNTLLDQLAISAELLARSERESAWREMARQVAHEIKNPLTPMRLSVQYLLKAWNDRDPDIDMKLKNISQTLISQIDTLSSIASAFSDFAVMPQPKPIILNLSQLLSKVVNLFDHQDNITFELSVDTTSPALVEADPENLNRIFTNLIKNSIQAIGNKHDAYIRLYLEETEDNYFVRIEDTGKGMTDEEAKKVFTPNFTTKSSGMGMGLSIVYSLVQQIGGSIIFETKPGEGTTFIIGLPKAKNPS